MIINKLTSQWKVISFEKLDEFFCLIHNAFMDVFFKLCVLSLCI